MTSGDKDFLEVQYEKTYFGFWRISIVSRELDVWVSTNADGWPTDRFRHMSAAKARAKSKWALCQPYWFVMLFGSYWQRRWRRIWRKREQR